MPITKYTKAYRPPARMSPPKSRSKHNAKRLMPVLLMGIGILLLGNVMVPLLTYLFFTGPNLRAGAQEAIQGAKSPFLVREYLFPTAKPTPIVVAMQLDYTDLSNWFPEHELPILPPQKVETYTISIPVLGIEKAEVTIGGKDLDKSLIQYPGTAEPGDFGAPVIFGHSVLRQFYNPKITNPRRYNSIFSTIMTLKHEDEIFLTHDDVTYRYEVVNKMEVKPEDRYILEQQRSSKQLKLVTCVPEGTYLARGVITAVLKE